MRSQEGFKEEGVLNGLMLLLPHSLGGTCVAFSLIPVLSPVTPWQCSELALWELICCFMISLQSKALGSCSPSAKHYLFFCACWIGSLEMERCRDQGGCPQYLQSTPQMLPVVTADRAVQVNDLRANCS